MKTVTKNEVLFLQARAVDAQLRKQPIWQEPTVSGIRIRASLVCGTKDIRVRNANHSNPACEKLPARLRKARMLRCQASLYRHHNSR